MYTHTVQATTKPTAGPPSEAGCLRGSHCTWMSLSSLGPISCTSAGAWTVSHLHWGQWQACTGPHRTSPGRHGDCDWAYPEGSPEGSQWHFSASALRGMTSTAQNATTKGLVFGIAKHTLNAAAAHTSILLHSCRFYSDWQANSVLSEFMCNQVRPAYVKLSHLHVWETPCKQRWIPRTRWSSSPELPWPAWGWCCWSSHDVDSGSCGWSRADQRSLWT